MSSTPIPTWAIAAAAAVGAVTVKTVINGRSRNPRGLPYPPGPKGLPVLGNLFQIPQEKPWEVFSEWGREHGDVIYLEALGVPIVVLNSLEACVELLEKRSLNYSDRAEIPAVDMMALNWSFAMMSYGPSWRAHRRAFHQFMSHTQMPVYRPIIEEETLTFLRRLLHEPKEFLESARYLFGSIIMRISYGETNFDYNKSLILDGENLIEGFSEMVVPGRLVVNSVPALRHVPDWFPGTGWKRELARLRVLSERVVTKPFNDVKERMKRSTDKEEYPSIARGFLEKLAGEDLSKEEYETQEAVGRNTAALSYIAGADTSVSTTQSLFLALAMHPEVREKARAEVEQVVGKDKLPHPSDVARLPYIQAIVKEHGRWHVIVPFAIPHQSREDDEYNGFFIPKGATIMPNSWAIMHDEKVFEAPFEFRPERYLTKDGQIDKSVLDPDSAVFGYGRRICPGRHLSNEALGFMVASLLLVFDVRPPKNEKGEPIKLELKTLSDLVAKPLPFECEIVPRSAAHIALISQSA